MRLCMDYAQHSVALRNAAQRRDQHVCKEKRQPLMHGIYMDYRGLCMGHAWITHGLWMEYVWITHGLCMDCEWDMHGLRIASWIELN